PKALDHARVEHHHPRLIRRQLGRLGQRPIQVPPVEARRFQPDLDLLVGGRYLSELADQLLRARAVVPHAERRAQAGPGGIEQTDRVVARTDIDAHVECLEHSTLPKRTQWRGWSALRLTARR